MDQGPAQGKDKQLKGIAAGLNETQGTIGQLINRTVPPANQRSQSKGVLVSKGKSAAYKLAVSRDYFKEFEAHHIPSLSLEKGVKVEYYGDSQRPPGQESFVVHRHAGKKRLKESYAENKTIDNETSSLDTNPDNTTDKTNSGDQAAAAMRGVKEPAADYNQLMKLAGKLGKGAAAGGGGGGLPNGPMGGTDYAENGRVPSQLPEALGPMDYNREAGQDYADGGGNGRQAAQLGKKKPTAAASPKAPGNGTTPLGGKMTDLSAKNNSTAAAGLTANATKAGNNGSDPLAASNNVTGVAPGNKALPADLGAKNASSSGADNATGNSTKLGAEPGLDGPGSMLPKNSNGTNSAAALGGAGPGLGMNGAGGAAATDAAAPASEKNINVGQGKVLEAAGKTLPD